MRYDLILQDRKAYSYEGYASRQVASVLENKQIPFKLIYLSDGILHDYITYIKEHPPRSMICFEDLLSFSHPLCDVVQVPLFFWVENSLAEAAHLLDSAFGRVGLPFICNESKTYYLPHGVEKISAQSPQFDTVFFSPLVDLTCLEKRWEELYSKQMLEIIYQALKLPYSPYESVKKIIGNNKQFFSLISAVETYRRAEYAYDTISQYEGGYLDVFGEHIGNNWLQRLPDAKWVRLHYKLPYSEHYEVLKASKRMILDPLQPHWHAPARALGCLLKEDQQNHSPVSWEQQTLQLIEYLNES